MKKKEKKEGELMATTKQSTWRQHTIDIDPGVVEEFVFPDTKPNHVLLHNMGVGKVFVGVSLIPSPTLYDMQVSSYSESMYAQETGFTRIRMFNSGTDSQLVKITSFEHDFDPTVIKPTRSATTEGGGGTIEGPITGEMVVTGFQAPLPSGSNNIGRVVVTEIPAQTIEFTELPPGANLIGRVKVDTLPALSSGVSHIGSVGIDGGVTISSMPPVTVSNEPVKQSHQSFEGTITTTEIVFDMGVETINRIQYIVNEGDTDIYISFDDIPATPTITSGLNKPIRIKPGETVNDMPRKSNKIRFIRATGSGLVRFLGV